MIFKNVRGIKLPEGRAKALRIGGVKVWSKSEPGTEGLVYTLSDDGTYYVCTGFSSEVEVVPIHVIVASEVEGIPVKEIGMLAFDGAAIKSIKLPSSITHIKEYAFNDCTYLTQVVGLGLIDLGVGAFYGCRALATLEIGESLKYIRNNSFANCTSLKTLIIPISVRHITGTPFVGCGNLTVYCEAESQPGTWVSYWSEGVKAVVWGFKGDDAPIAVLDETILL